MVNITTGKQRGVVILENMIAVLIFSMGILGLAGLLVTSMKNTASARYRNEASMLASQVIGQMWLGDKLNTALKTNFESPDGAQYTTWKTRVADALPGTADHPPTISIDASNVATVTIQWQAPGEAAAHSYVVLARING